MLKFLFLLFAASAFAADPFIVAIAGASGSGKTTLAENLKRAFGDQVLLLSEDNYYKDLSHLSMHDREKINFDHPDSLDFAQLRSDLLLLKQGHPVEIPTYDFKTHTRCSETLDIHPHKIIVIEGILLFAVPDMLDLFDLKVFMEADADVCLLRRIERDLKERGRTFEFCKKQYLDTVKPMRTQFIDPSKIHADILIPKGGQNEQALDIIISKLREGLRNGI